MNIPFTSEQFLDVFKNYNLTVWPMQVVLFLLAIIAVYHVKRIANSGKAISIMLSLLWLWMGIVYNFIFFSDINKAAYLFGSAFIVQAFLFFYYGFIQNKLSFEFHSDLYGMMGNFLIVFALIIYPVLGYFFDHVYPYSPTFGLPCPTTIFTFGLLLFLKKCPVTLLIIPALWSIVGFSAALTLNVYEDFSLIISGLISTTMLISHNMRFRTMMVRES